MFIWILLLILQSMNVSECESIKSKIIKRCRNVAEIQRAETRQDGCQRVHERGRTPKRWRKSGKR